MIFIDSNMTKVIKFKKQFKKAQKNNEIIFLPGFRLYFEQAIKEMELNLKYQK